MSRAEAIRDLFLLLVYYCTGLLAILAGMFGYIDKPTATFFIAVALFYHSLLAKKD